MTKFKDTQFEGLTPEARKTLTKPVLLHWALTYMRCAICSDKLLNGFHDDHIKPLSMGGTNAPDNRQPLCKPCHKTKTKSEYAARVKADSQGGRRGSQINRRKKRGGSSIPAHINGLSTPPGYKHKWGKRKMGQSGYSNVRVDD